ncbi:MAG: Rpn family recombination-promoting nuclease/putative transposase [Synergistaceae bacterium]|nr:Rpn family recombination-promoting nuclease/putative transposase [Synergistaceae bacterium]
MIDYAEDIIAFGPEAEREIEELEREGALPKELDRFRDHYLKFLLAAPERKNILLDLLNTMLRLMGYEGLTDIEPMDRELSPRFGGGRGMRLDYLGRTASGRIVNLEFQKDSGGDFIKRALYCSGTIMHRQLLGGDPYGKICQTVFIGILNSTLFRRENNWYWDFVLKHPKSGRVLTDDLLLMFVEMNKLKRALSELRAKARRGGLDRADLATRLALWGAYVTNEGVDIVAEAMAKDEIFSEVMEAEKDYWGESRNRFIQMMQEKHERDALWELENARKKGLAVGLAEGLAEGRAEGLSEGLAEGRAEGLSEGRAEGEAKGKTEVALNLVRSKVDIDTIAKWTGLSVDEIKSL